MNKKRLLIVLLLLALVVATPLLAQITAHYDLSWSVLSGGGGPRSSGHYQVDDVLGQWPAGLSRSAHYQLAPGFWPGGDLAQHTRLYLPVISGARP